MSKNAVVYWSPYWEDFKSWNLLYKEPESLMKRLNKKKASDMPKSNFLRCPAYIDTFKNTYVVNSTLKADYEISKGKLTKSEGYYANFQHSPTLENQMLLFVAMGWLFFTEEESLIMQVTPPYFEKTNHSNFGAVMPGQYDIGQWFRPLNLEFILWENVNKLTIEENEPLVYFNFETSKKVELKRFDTNATLNGLAVHMSSFSDLQPVRSLADRYKLFKQTRTKDIILREIKKNVL
jgi:hypothetical protein